MARAFDSTAKKLAIPVFALFEIGWIVFIAGFILLFKIKIRDRDIILDDNDIGSLVYLAIPYFMILVGGQIVVLLGLLHAALPSGTASSIIGTLSTVLNIIYFVSVGYLIGVSSSMILYFKWGKYYQEDNQLQVDHDDEQRLVRAASLMLAGSIVLVVSWSLVQFVSFFYEHRLHTATRKLWYVITECWKNRTILVRDVSEAVRLASIPAMLLSAIGWGTFMGGLFINMNVVLIGLCLLGSWSAVIITPFMYLVSLFHAGCTGMTSTVLGIIASILNTFFIVGMGFSVTFTGQFLYLITLEHVAAVLDYTQLDVEEMKNHCRIMLGGGVVCLIFWTIVLVLWPFYQPKGTSDRMKNGMNSNDYDYHPLLPASSSATECTESHENMDQCHAEAEAISL